MSEQILQKIANSISPIVPAAPTLATPTSTESAKTGSANKYDRWVKSTTAAAARIEAGIVIPQVEPTFQVSPEAKIFAIGSCFARNLETAFLQEKTQIISADPDSEVLEIKTNLKVGSLNKYNPISIQQELAWASGAETFPAGAFVEYAGKYCDLSVRAQSRQGSLELMQSRREQLRAHFARAFEADLVVVTLGLIEAWRDRETGLVLAEAPSPRLLQQYPERFAFEVLSYEDCLQALQAVWGLLQAHGKPDAKLLVTVSPVALLRTFSGQDVIVANMMSKSILRAVAGAWAAATESIDYFPSYEAAMLSDPNLVWMADRRNISDFMVAQIVGEFARRYGLKPALSPTEFAAIAERVYRTRLERTQQSLQQLLAAS